MPTVNKLPYLVSVSTSEVTLTLRDDRLYTLYHTGKDAAGAASTGEVYAQCDDESVETTYGEKEGKIVLQSSKSFPVPPGVTTVKLKKASGTSMIQVLASQKLIGGVN